MQIQSYTFSVESTTGSRVIRLLQSGVLSLDLRRFGMPRYVRILHVRFTVAVGYECRVRSGSSWSRVSYQCTSTGDTYSPTCHLLNSFLKFKKVVTNTRQAALRQTTCTISSIKGRKSCRRQQTTTDSVFQFVLTTELFDGVLQRITPVIDRKVTNLKDLFQRYLN